jgi:hypothetical protein
MIRPLLERLRLAPAHPTFTALVKDAADEIEKLEREKAELVAALALAAADLEVYPATQGPGLDRRLAKIRALLARHGAQR